MNTDNIDSKVAELEKAIEAECAGARKSLTTTAIAYAILVIFVFGYTTIIFNLIAERATPAALVATVTSYAQAQLPVLKDQIKRETKNNAPVIANKLMLFAHDFIPRGEAFVKSQIDAATETQLRKVQDVYMPQFAAELNKTMESAEKQAESLKDNETPKAFAIFIADALDQELGKILDENAKRKMAWLRDEITSLSAKPDARLNAREIAEKRLLIHWLFLVNNAEVGQTPFSSSLRLVSAFASHVDGFFIEDAPVTLSAPAAAK